LKTFQEWWAEQDPVRSWSGALEALEAAYNAGADAVYGADGPESAETTELPGLYNERGRE
jgi:hypothetical protein